MSISRISILGSGVVGTATGKGLASLGHQVVFYDIDERRVRLLNRSGLTATAKMQEALHGSEVSFVCVPTPLSGNRMDIGYIRNAVKDLAYCLRSGSSYHLTVVKSTVLPMTTERVVIPLLEKISKRSVGEDLGVCVNPEFLTEINRTWTDDEEFSRSFSDEDRIVIGEFDKRSGDALEALYKSLNIPKIRTDLRTAELIKFACNCALASRISYWNEIFYICKQSGTDSEVVAKVAAMDERIGKYGTVHGKAFGGKCLPKDLRAFITYSKRSGYTPKLLKAIWEVNEKIKVERGVRE